MKPRLTPRSVALGLIFAVLLCAITPYNDYKVGATYLAGNQFPVGAIFVLFVLSAPLNAIFRRVAPRFVFNRSELLTVWTLILVASGLPSSGLMRFLLPHLAAPQNFSNGANSWEARVWGGLPEWFRLSDKAAAEAYFTGYPRGQEYIPWEAWWRPLLAWGAFGVCFWIATFCLASILRRQWIENEKFVFPLVSLPLLLSEDPRPGRRFPELFYNRALWIGVGFTTSLHTLNGLHQMYPAIPGITTTINFEEYLTSPPFNQIGLMPMIFFPLVMGLSYLLASEVAFSLWFFFLFYKAEILVAAVYNWNAGGSYGSPAERQFHALQGFGGAIALLMWTLWTARRHLRNIWFAATGDRTAAEGFREELLSPRVMVFGLLFAYIGMGVWLYLATIPPLLIAVSLLTVTISLITLSWLVTQAGTLYTIAPSMAVDTVGGLIGTGHASPGAWYMNQRVECIYYRDTRELLLPELLSGAKAAEAGQTPLRPLLFAMIATLVLGLVVSLVASLWLPYYNGGANSLPNVWAFRTGPQRPLQLTGNLATAPLPGSWWNAGHIGGGFLWVLLLLIARARFGFGLHPIGFIGPSVLSGRTLWFSILLGWLCKTLILRFGGMGGYRAALPFFFGLILGDILNAIVWIVLGTLTGVGYNLLPQ